MKSTPRTALLGMAFVICIVFLTFARTRGRTVAVGAWTHGLWDPSTKTVHTEALSAFERRADKKMAIAHIYVGWHDLDTDEFVRSVSSIVAKGWMPLISSNPYFHETCVSNGENLYRSIARGDCDGFLRALGRRLRTIDSPFMFRFAWEMNIPANEWSIEYTKSKPDDFVAAWRHIHTMFAKGGVTNIIWVFAPNVQSNMSAGFHEYYPGNNFVDWVALDGYNWGTTQAWSQWLEFYDIFHESYDELTSLAPDKPFMISEFGTTNEGGDKAAWYKDTLEQQIPTRFPNIRALVFYDEDRRVREGADWRIDSGTDGLTAVRAGLKQGLYTSELPK